MTARTIRPRAAVRLALWTTVVCVAGLTAPVVARAAPPSIYTADPAAYAECNSPALIHDVKQLIASHVDLSAAQVRVGDAVDPESSLNWSQAGDTGSPASLLLCTYAIQVPGSQPARWHARLRGNRLSLRPLAAVVAQMYGVQ